MSGSHSNVEEIERPENLAQQRREWLVERVGWAAIGLALAAAILGGLGPGILGRREVTSADGSVRIKFFAVERYEAPCELEIELLVPRELEATDLVVSRSLPDGTTAEQIVPPASSIASQGDKLVLTFRAEADEGTRKVIYRYKHDRFGVLHYEVGLKGHEPVNVRQVVLP